LGHNGAGKTTSIKCILNLVAPQSGVIEIFGHPFQDPKSREHLGYVPEQPYFYDNLSVAELLELYATLAGVKAGERKAAIQTALDRVHLEGRLNQKLRGLSKGLMQRVAMAQAIVARPKLLILDEPFSGLDPIGRKEFRELLLELKGEGCAIFLCTHVLSDVELLCDRVSIMSRGELKGVFPVRSEAQEESGHYDIQVRSFEKFLSSSNVSADEIATKRPEHLVLRLANRARAEQLLQEVLRHGAILERYECCFGNLEDLFTRLVEHKEGAH
jgi:ABC-2 type transport system ATP-binding protein